VLLVRHSLPPLHCRFPFFHVHAWLQDGSTALIDAAGNGYPDCVCELLAAGANKEAVNGVSSVETLPSRTLVHMYF
jgi:hypothetical protein